MGIDLLLMRWGTPYSERLLSDFPGRAHVKCFQVSRWLPTHRKAQKHGRHASMDATMIFDDALSDFAGEVTKVISKRWKNDNVG